MRRLSSKRWGLLAPATVIGLGLLACLWDIVPVQVLRNALFDQYQRWQPREYVAAPVLIIDIDDESLRRFGQWPWPRTRIAELTARLQDAQAAVIAFDIVFAEPDRTSPKAMLDVWQPPAPLREQISRLADHDEVLADVFARGKVVLALAFDHQARTDAQPLPAGLQASRYVMVGEFPRAHTHGFTGAVTALPAFQAVAAGNGALKFVPDSDGVVRRVPLVLRVGSTLVPTLAAEAMRVAQGLRTTSSTPVPLYRRVLKMSASASLPCQQRRMEKCGCTSQSRLMRAMCQPGSCWPGVFHQNNCAEHYAGRRLCPRADRFAF